MRNHLAIGMLLAAVLLFGWVAAPSPSHAQQLIPYTCHEYYELDEDIPLQPRILLYSSGGGWHDEYISDVNVALCDIDYFWSTVFPEEWSSTPFFSLTQAAESVGGVNPFPAECPMPQGFVRFNAVYCTDAHMIIWDANFFWDKYRRIGDMAVVIILAHEYGHAVQEMTGEGPNRAVFKELQADCFAGAYVAFAEERGSLEPGDFTEASHSLWEAGDLTESWLNPVAHGTPEQRQFALEMGYVQGVRACRYTLIPTLIGMM